MSCATVAPTAFHTPRLARHDMRQGEAFDRQIAADALGPHRDPFAVQLRVVRPGHGLSADVDMEAIIDWHAIVTPLFDEIGVCLTFINSVRISHRSEGRSKVVR